MTKTSMLRVGLQQAAQGKEPVSPPAKSMPAAQERRPVSKPASRRRRRQVSGKTLIGGMYDPEVRRTLGLIELDPRNQGRSLQDLLGEAINDLCVKYGKPQPYRPDPEDDL